MEVTDKGISPMNTMELGRITDTSFEKEDLKMIELGRKQHLQYIKNLQRILDKKPKLKKANNEDLLPEPYTNVFSSKKLPSIKSNELVKFQSPENKTESAYYTQSTVLLTTSRQWSRNKFKPSASLEFFHERTQFQKKGLLRINQKNQLESSINKYKGPKIVKKLYNTFDKRQLSTQESQSKLSPQLQLMPLPKIKKLVTPTAQQGPLMFPESICIPVCEQENATITSENIQPNSTESSPLLIPIKIQVRARESNNSTLSFQTSNQSISNARDIIRNPTLKARFLKPMAGKPPQVPKQKEFRI